MQQHAEESQSASSNTNADDEVTLDNFYTKKEQVPKFWRGSWLCFVGLPSPVNSNYYNR